MREAPTHEFQQDCGIDRRETYGQTDRHTPERHTEKQRGHVELAKAFTTHWESEASPTLGCSIEISRDIYPYVCQYVCRFVHKNTYAKMRGQNTWPKHAHAQSHFLAVKTDL